MSKNWHHFSAKEHIQFLEENGFVYAHTRSSHDYYIKQDANGDRIVQVITSKKEQKRQSRKTMDMSSRHSGISKDHYKKWINE